MSTDEMPDSGGKWFAFPESTDSSFKYAEVAERLKLPGGTIAAMFEDGELAHITPAKAAEWFGPEHRCWHVYWRGARAHGG